MKKVVSNDKNNLMDHGRKINLKQQSLFTSVYCPKLDMSHELYQDNMCYSPELIGILCWTIEMVRADITFEMSLFSIQLSMPRHGHLDQAFEIFAYLMCHPNPKLVKNPEQMFFGRWFKG